MAPGLLDGAFLGVSHPVLYLGEGLLDRIEVGRVWRQEAEGCAGSPDALAHGGGFVAAEIVHDDDVAWFEDRDELLLDIGAEARAVDRSVEDAGSGEPVAARGAEEGHCAPVAVRGKAAQALAPRPPAAQRRHVGLDPGFVDEDQPAGIEAALPGSPPLSLAGDVGPGLLKGEQRFF